MLKTPVCRRHGQRGQAVVLVLLATSIFLLGAVGLAIDGSQLYAQRQMAQAAADAAAQAGIISIFHGTNTSSNPFGTSAFTCTTSDARTPCVYAQSNGFGTSADTVSVTFPTSVSGVTLDPSFTPAAIAVTVHRTVNTTLIRFVGPSTAGVTAAATAAVTTSPISNCITTLNGSASGALLINGSADLNAPTCGIAVDSSSSSALIVNGSPTVTADAIQVVGGDILNGNPHVTPTPTTNATAMSDPLASVPAPSYNASCTAVNKTVTGSAPLSPGTYCGGILINGSGFTVTFSAGTYILLGGGLTVNGSPTLSGSNLTFYNTYDSSYPYGTITFNGSPTVNLSATTSGSLAGILFFQDRSAPSSYVTINGSANMNLVGTLYFPKSQVTYNGSSSSSSQNIAIIADTVVINGSDSLKIDPTQAGFPQQPSVALVQ